MWRHLIELPSRWLSLEEALAFLGISEARFRRCLEAGLIRTDGKGAGKRYDAEDVHAVGVLLPKLSRLLGDEPEPPPE